jgi:tripartite-type tricarboxylate transporter receptor subunit TctC
MIIVNNDLPVHSVAELVALLRKQPGQLSYGSGGPGTSQHLACEMFKLATKTFAVHIPYRGSGPALADLMGGQVQFAIDSVSAALGNVQGGRLRAIAVTSAQRSLALPDVPTVAESGLPELRNFEAVGWGAMVGPAGMPGAIVEKITRDFETVLRDPTIVERVAATGSVVRPVSGPAFSRYIADEIRKWGAAARASNTHLG